MKALGHILRRFAQDDRGVTAIEYALIASIMAVMLVPVIADTTSGVASLYTRGQGYFTDITAG